MSGSTQEVSRPRRATVLVRNWAISGVGAALAIVVPVVAGLMLFWVSPSRLVLVVPGVTALLVAAGAILARRRGRVGRPLAVGVAIGAALSTLWWAAAILPPSQANRPAATRGPVWHLSTGSTIAYASTPSAGMSSGQSPVIFLHGGPGIAERAPLLAFARRLDLPRRPMYAYDQVGAGASSRLDPAEYGLERDVADLEAIREEIGARRLILVGHSYGATVAAAYSADFPDRVDRMVLVSPGPIDADDYSTNNLYGRFSGEDRRHVFGYALRPRPLTTYLLSLLDPVRARDVVPDSEADAVSSELVRRAAPALYCTGDEQPSSMVAGNYRMQVEPLPPSAAQEEKLRTHLPAVQAPTLILKGSCDYLSWDSAMDYWRLLPRSHICYVEGAGHNVLEEQDDLVPAVVRRFVQHGQWCPDPAEGEAPPSYEGLTD